MNKYAKAIVAGVLAGAAAFQAAQAGGASVGQSLVTAAVSAVVVGLTTWGVPNEQAPLEEVQGDTLSKD